MQHSVFHGLWRPMVLSAENAMAHGMLVAILKHGTISSKENNIE